MAVRRGLVGGAGFVLAYFYRFNEKSSSRSSDSSTSRWVNVQWKVVCEGDSMKAMSRFRRGLAVNKSRAWQPAGTLRLVFRLDLWGRARGLTIHHLYLLPFLSFTSPFKVACVKRRRVLADYKMNDLMEGTQCCGPAPQASHLFRLPAEIRNYIMDLALVTDGPVQIDDTFRWPGVTGACLQLREETLSIFLSGNTFDCYVNDLDHAVLTAFLNALKGLDSRQRAMIKTVRVNCVGKLLIHAKSPMANTQRALRYSIERYRGPLPYFTLNLDFWNNLILQIKDSNLRPRQLEWPGVTGDGSDPESYRRSLCAVVEPVLFSRYVRTPLLRQHGLYDILRPPVDVLQQVSHHPDRFGLGLAATRDVWQLAMRHGGVEAKGQYLKWERNFEIGS